MPPKPVPNGEPTANEKWRTIMLTIRQITAMKPGEWRTDGGARGAGTLVFHASSSGRVSGYFRHTLPTGKRYDMPLGLFDETGKTGLTLASLRERAGEYSRMYQAGIRDLRAHFQAEAQAKAQAEEAERIAQEEEETIRIREALTKEQFTLRKLLEAYTDHLEKIGKIQSAKDVRSIFKVHILTVAPDLANQQAKEVTKAALAARIREIRESGKERAAGKTRAYLFAAYNLALRAEGDTEAPASLIPFQIESNPLVGIKAIPVRSAERTLSREELHTLIGKLGSSLVDQALKLCLFSGGQRAEQVLRARCSDYDPATGILRLLDYKGRRIQPREHRLPLGPIASNLCKVLVERARQIQPDETDPPLFANGAKCLVPTTLTHRVAELCDAMGGAKFSFRDLRRTTETEMASIGFSVDLRSQLLSHGLSGVQAKHYDRHSYLNEKKSALEKWEGHLEGTEPTK